MRVNEYLIEYCMRALEDVHINHIDLPGLFMHIVTSGNFPYQPGICSNHCSLSFDCTISCICVYISSCISDLLYLQLCICSCISDLLYLSKCCMTCVCSVTIFALFNSLDLGRFPPLGPLSRLKPCLFVFFTEIQNHILFRIS